MDASDCPSCGKRTFILEKEIRNGRKGYMGKCYDCGFEKWIDQGPSKKPDNTNDTDFWTPTINTKWWL